MVWDALGRRVLPMLLGTEIPGFLGTRWDPLGRSSFLHTEEVISSSLVSPTEMPPLRRGFSVVGALDRAGRPDRVPYANPLTGIRTRWWRRMRMLSRLGECER